MKTRLYLTYKDGTSATYDARTVLVLTTPDMLVLTTPDMLANIMLVSDRDGVREIILSALSKIEVFFAEQIIASFRKEFDND